MNALLRVGLPRDRSKTGKLELLVPTDPDLSSSSFPWTLNAGPFVCLGKSDNEAAADAGNPSRDPLHVDGDFPLGEYSAQLVKWPAAPGPVSRREYGPYGYIVLTPVSGDALTAQLNGRDGLRVHAGDPSLAGGLRPTHGCLRLSNRDFLALLQAIEKLGPLNLFRLTAAELPDVPLPT